MKLWMASLLLLYISLVPRNHLSHIFLMELFTNILAYYMYTKHELPTHKTHFEKSYPLCVSSCDSSIDATPVGDQDFSETNNVPCTVLYLPYVLPIAFHTHTDISYI
jgi:hypothetical protein